MDTYYLHNHIHVVKGAKKHCIYDLKKRRLYSINQSGLNMINHFLSPKEKELSMSENTFLKELLDYEILTIENKAFKKAIIKKANITFAWIEVTKSCNLRCIHCYNEAEYHEYSNSIMKFSDFCYAVDMLEDMGNGKKHGLLYYANGPSLEEINSTVPVPKEGGFFKKLMFCSYYY